MDYNQKHRGDVYATYGMDPACQVFDIHRGDRMKTLVIMDTKAVNGLVYIKKSTGKKVRDFQNGNQTTALIRTGNGKAIPIQHNVMTPRPCSRMYQVVGADGYASKYPIEEYCLRSTQVDSNDVPNHEKLNAHDSVPEDVEKALMAKYKDPIHKELEETAKKVGGHGGMDHIMDYRPVYCLRNGLPLDMDVYDLAKWRCMAELTRFSIKNGSAPVEVPDLIRGGWNRVQDYRHAFAEQAVIPYQYIDLRIARLGKSQVTRKFMFGILLTIIITYMKVDILKPSRQTILREAKDYVMTAVGMILYDTGWTVPLPPSDIMTGGVSGIASVVYWVTGFPVQYTYLSINFFLLLLALKLLGLKLRTKIIFEVFTLTSFLSVTQQPASGVFLLRDQSFMACVIETSFCGGGIGVAFCANGSTSGTDVIAAIINKYRDITLGEVILICDMIVITSDYFVLEDWEKVVYGLVTLYICSLVLDQVVSSTRRSVQFFIIFNKYEKIGRHTNEYPHRGMTIINATGFYTDREVKVMFVLAKKRESTIISRLVKDIDPNAFVS